MLGSEPQSNAVDSVEGIQETVLRLSADIGTMADRIGEMADRIGQMADRILETQRIQSDNLKTFQENSLEMARILSDQLTANQRLVAQVIEKLGD
ncbi:hypothetical protein [Halochromatium glycolicum]|jgi:TolA-binding protein|uniref:Uncharacterized protein n=1 Tax=Halochromatium glycolicum TaxID=85075 RepID=A0AAJ0X8M5_9GAMM|nr:hypothetical protein [Halochromatium glycolicum]MBK1704031.1 hypothetical protein [Halochromatium glycolicum]